jgi:hypothetical protein
MTELSTEEKRAALAKVEFFAHCSERQLADVAHLAVERDLDAGAELCHEGEFEQHAFVVLDGEATASVGGSTVGSVGPGEVVGELAMLGDGHRKATLVARTRCGCSCSTPTTSTQCSPPTRTRKRASALAPRGRTTTDSPAARHESASSVEVLDPGSGSDGSGAGSGPGSRRRRAPVCARPGSIR